MEIDFTKIFEMGENLRNYHNRFTVLIHTVVTVVFTNFSMTDNLTYCFTHTNMNNLQFFQFLHMSQSTIVSVDATKCTDCLFWKLALNSGHWCLENLENIFHWNLRYWNFLQANLEKVHLCQKRQKV